VVKSDEDAAGDVTMILTKLVQWAESKAVERGEAGPDVDWVQQLAKVSECAQCLLDLHDASGDVMRQWTLFKYGLSVTERLMVMKASGPGDATPSVLLKQSVDTYAAYAKGFPEEHFHTELFRNVHANAERVLLEHTKRELASAREAMDTAKADLQAVAGGMTDGSLWRDGLPPDTSATTWVSLNARAAETLMKLSGKGLTAKHIALSKAARWHGSYHMCVP
jgi:hypothetical protein